jgi:pancreatic triacylglycerol lipase
VDWETGASTANYITARNRAGTIGAITAVFINFLEAQTGVDLNTINVIGYSLGGHVAGFVGKNTQGRLNTIIASDPAAPLFNMDSPDDRLADTDAQYVETIITAGGTMGMWGPLGVANFYPNGGSSQPGCGIDVSGACAHERANFLIAESIASPVSQFVGRRCGDLSEIQSGMCFVTGPEAALGGEPSNFGRGASGVYALNTNSASPFAQG